MTRSHKWLLFALLVSTASNVYLMTQLFWWQDFAIRAVHEHIQTVKHYQVTTPPPPFKNHWADPEEKAP